MILIWFNYSLMGLSSKKNPLLKDSGKDILSIQKRIKPNRHIEYIDYVNLCVYVVFSFFTLKFERILKIETLEVEVSKLPTHQTTTAETDWCYSQKHCRSGR